MTVPLSDPAFEEAVRIIYTAIQEERKSCHLPSLDFGPEEVGKVPIVVYAYTAALVRIYVIISFNCIHLSAGPSLFARSGLEN